MPLRGENQQCQNLWSTGIAAGRIMIRQNFFWSMRQLELEQNLKPKTKHKTWK